MKTGFQIEIAKNLDLEESKIAIEFANEWIKKAIDNKLSWKHETRGGWKSFYKRGTAGLRIHNSNGLYFRRASNGRRIFQIVRGSDLVIKPQLDRWGCHHDAPLGTSCMCPDHEGGLKVENKYGDIPTYLYARIGDIKG